MTTAGTMTSTGEPMPTGEAQVLATLLQTLGDPTRLRILTALDMACVPVSAIVEATGVRQPTVSHHLRILRDRGLVRGERRGGYVFYCLAGDGLRAALDGLRPLAWPSDDAQ
ncbi:ArsR/SmtB family transcription factor [Streptomyces sp. NPDC014983]|uniref:ArsR/SmtB family transcription factor n=1 Tax=Streptomyces sp. NPDC014983 TaxID=3364933 RepID=UPI0036FF29D5